MKNGLRLVFLLAVLAFTLVAGTTSADGGYWCDGVFVPCSSFDKPSKGCYYGYDPEIDCCRRIAGPITCVGGYCCP